MKGIRLKWIKFVSGFLTATLLAGPFLSVPVNAESARSDSAEIAAEDRTDAWVTSGDAEAMTGETVTAGDAEAMTGETVTAGDAEATAGETVTLEESGENAGIPQAAETGATAMPEDADAMPGTAVISEETAESEQDTLEPEQAGGEMSVVQQEAAAEGSESAQDTPEPERTGGENAAIPAVRTTDFIARETDSGGRPVLTRSQIRFVKKKSSVFAGEKDVFVGRIKYSEKEDYIRDFTAVAYDKRGDVQQDIICDIEYDEELYVSVGAYVAPGSYKVVVYAGTGGEKAGMPQSGTMYQTNLSFALTVKAGIFYIDTSRIVSQVATNGKKTTFSAVPVGIGYKGKTGKQKFTYEIKSAVPVGSGFTTVNPVDKVRSNISVNSKGKVTIDADYPVEEDAGKNYIAIVITAADYDGNETTATAYVQILNQRPVPTTIYLVSGSGERLGNNLFADNANGSRIVVLDQNGNNMNRYVTITPADNTKHTKGAYVSHSGGSSYFYVRKPGIYTVKATTRDGKKKSKSVKITISAPEVESAIYSLRSITCNSLSAGDITFEKDKITYSAPRGSVIRIRQGAKIGGTDYWNSGWFDWKYSLDGGSLKKDGDDWLITPKERTCELTTWAKANPEKTWTLRFVNHGIYDYEPEVSVTEGRLYSNRYTNSSELIYYYNEYYGREEYEVPEQRLTCVYDGGSYDRIEIVPVTKSAPGLSVSDHIPAQRTFQVNLSPGNDIKTGSFKYKIGFYREGILRCAPVSVTIKIKKAAPVKVTSSYTLKLSQGEDCVELKSTPTGFVPDYDTELLNANEGGSPNLFNKYFELAYTADPTGKRRAVIRFKDSVTSEERESLRRKRLTGYVRYSYFYGYSSVKNSTAKVTITIK